MALTPMNAQRLSRIDEVYCLPSEMFIAVLYQEILGRSADEAGIAHYIKLMELGSTRTDIIHDFLCSPEATKRKFSVSDIPLRWKLEKKVLGKFKKFLFWLYYPAIVFFRKEITNFANAVSYWGPKKEHSGIVDVDQRILQLERKFIALQQAQQNFIKNSSTQIDALIFNKLNELDQKNQTLERQLRFFQTTWFNEKIKSNSTQNKSEKVNLEPTLKVDTPNSNYFKFQENMT